MDSKAECDQLVAHVARKIYKKDLKQTHAISHLVRYRLKIREFKAVRKE